jgi:hypothetical protein
MKAILIKTPEQLYKLKFYNDEDMLACATALLSKQNCDEIFGVVDVEKLAEDFAKNHSIYPTAQDDTEYGFKQGFKKAMELYEILHPTEIEVEIIMKNSRTGNIVKHDSDLEWDEDGLCDRAIPKLDSEGCLILKKI